MIQKLRKKQRKMKTRNQRMYLDSAATKSLFCDKDLLNNVRKSKYKTEIQTNTGTGEVTKEGDVPGFKTVMFSDQAIANLLVLNDLCERYHVTFDSKKENVFIVRLDDRRIMKFACDEDGMYSFSPGENMKKEAQHMEKEISHQDEEIHINSVPGRIEQVHIEKLGPRVRQL